MKIYENYNFPSLDIFIHPRMVTRCFFFDAKPCHEVARFKLRALARSLDAGGIGARNLDIKKTWR